MSTACVELKTATIADEYLGFTIEESPFGFTASPRGWTGPELFAESLPLVRKRIWFWWHRAA